MLKEGKKEEKEERRKERAVHMEGSCGNKVKLELGYEGLDHDGTDSVGSLKFKQ